jgi:hypothetical protein
MRITVVIPINRVLQDQLDLIRDKLQVAFKEIHKAVSAVNVCDAAARCPAADVDIDIAEVLSAAVARRLNIQLDEISRIVAMLGGRTHSATHQGDIDSVPL